MIDFAPMLAGSIDPQVLNLYISNPAWYLEQKLDGMRVIIEINDGEAQGYNRKGERVILYPQHTHPFASFSGHWVFDGEMVQGVFWIFDMPEALDKIEHSTAFQVRRQALEAVYASAFTDESPWVKLIDISRNAREKRQLVARVLENNGEGVMLKLRTAPYLPSLSAESTRRPVRSPNMLKVKYTETADCIIGEIGREGKASCSLFMYHDGNLQEIGSVKMTELNLHKVKMGDVVEIRYLYVWTDLRLVQPRFVRFRDDKDPQECTTDQLKLTNKTVLRKKATR